MPLTEFQSQVARLLSQNRSEDSHLAEGAALNFEPNSLRYSADLDYFHDSEQRVASAFAEDRKLLEDNNFKCKADLILPGYIRSIVTKRNNGTKVEWAHDSSWRFMPPIYNKKVGYQLHPIDLAINNYIR